MIWQLFLFSFLQLLAFFTHFFCQCFAVILGGFLVGLRFLEHLDTWIGIRYDVLLVLFAVLILLLRFLSDGQSLSAMFWKWISNQVSAIVEERFIIFQKAFGNVMMPFWSCLNFLGGFSRLSSALTYSNCIVRTVETVKVWFESDEMRRLVHHVGISKKIFDILRGYFRRLCSNFQENSNIIPGFFRFLAFFTDPSRLVWNK